MTTGKKKRRSPSNVYQEVSRCPGAPDANGNGHQLIRPGDWVLVRRRHAACPQPECLCGAVVLVRSITASVTERDQRAALWRIITDDGRAVLASDVARHATDAEIAEARRNWGLR